MLWHCIVFMVMFGMVCHGLAWYGELRSKMSCNTHTHTQAASPNDETEWCYTVWHVTIARLKWHGMLDMARHAMACHGMACRCL